MKKTLLISAALLCLGVGIASAGGINLAWTDCGASGQLQKNSACTSNSGVAGLLFASAIAPVPMDLLNGMAGVIDLQTNAAALSPWWGLQAGGCRSASLSFAFNFAAGPFSCADTWAPAGGASGGINVTNPFPTAADVKRMRIRAVCAVPGSVAVDDVTEGYMFELIINNAKTVGATGCAGCADGACIVLNSIQMTQPIGVGDFTLSNPINSQYVGWQAGAAGVGQGPNGTGCPGATPTQSKTWGSVKSLYR